MGLVKASPFVSEINKGEMIMTTTYHPHVLVQIYCTIRKLATEHYKYGKSMPLCFGKARGISEILRIFYDVDVSINDVWDVLKDFKEEYEISGESPF